MDKKALLVCTLGVLIAGVAAADITQYRYGHGLGGEYKTRLIPLPQQSGWNVQGESHAQPAAPKKQAQKPAPAKPVAAAPAPAEPAPVAKAVPESKWILNGVQFETSSDKIKSESAAVLDDAAQTLKANEHVVVEIQGHTDNMGDDSFNQDLSQRRAIAVKNYLTQKGIGAQRLEARGYGEKNPIADNNSSSGRAQNRRIEFKVLKR
jgi:outer membrane protein OmpA-like peptidoglycan-associated protein